MVSLRSPVFIYTLEKNIYIIQYESKTRRECLKSALYLRLKKRKLFGICPGRFYEKLRKQFRDAQRVPFMLDETRKPVFPQLGTRNIFF